MKKLTAKGVMSLARRRKAVVIPGRGIKRMPAAFLIGMPFNFVMFYIQSGVYMYKKKK